MSSKNDSLKWDKFYLTFGIILNTSTYLLSVENGVNNWNYLSWVRKFKKLNMDSYNTTVFMHS